MNEIERAEIERAIEIVEDSVNYMKTHYGKRVTIDAYELALKLLRAEQTRHENAPLTWNERINKMTVEEKVEWLNCTEFCRVTDIPIEECSSYKDCKECIRAFLNSPYTEGEKT